MNDIRHFIKIIDEARNPDIEYEEQQGKVIAYLRSHQSAQYTKLARKMERIDKLKDEISQLSDEIKTQTKEDIADLFDATDAASTRVVDTVSFIFTMSKDPKPTESYKYKEILDELTNHLTPELILVLETIKAAYKTETKRSPSLSKSEKLPESVNSDKFTKLNDLVQRWATRYDEKLDTLEHML